MPSFLVVALMDVFRGLIHQKEFSERGLLLSQQLLSVNAASYTVWSALVSPLYFFVD